MNDWTSDSDPRLIRILATTAAVPDLDEAEAAYVEWLGHRVLERSGVSAELAAQWALPQMAGARCSVLQAEGERDTFVRLIEVPATPDYRALTTFGWNAFEIIVDDVEALAERLVDSPFRVIGPPRPLQFMPSIVAMQAIGPGEECLYFTMESGARDSSILPPPSGFIGRTFIVVCAGPDFGALLRWYVNRFALRERPVRQSKVAIVQQAQELGEDGTIELSAIGMRQRGNLLELDGYPHGPGLVAGVRPRQAGILPPGNAIVTLEVDDLALADDLPGAPVQRLGDAIYGGRRMRTVMGPAGELIELVEPA